MKYIVPVHWTMCADLEIEADSPEEAAEKAANRTNIIEEDGGCYSDDSFVVCEDRVFTEED